MNPITVHQYSLNSFYLVFPFLKHQEIKNKLLEMISKQKPETLQVMDEYYGDNITKLDWSRATDINRLWVQEFKPHADTLLGEVANSCGYRTHSINELWFQQYEKDSVHGWHTHGSNFTGVYYLELPNDAPHTQIVNPLDQSTIIVPTINEGDILIFPSYVIHRAPKISSNLRKTIISFNCDFDGVNDKVLETITKNSESAAI